MATGEEKLKQLLSFKNESTTQDEFPENNNTIAINTFLNKFNTTDSNDCSLEDFAIYFLNEVRQQIEVHLHSKTDTEVDKHQTPIRKAGSDDNTATTPKRLLFNQQQSTPLKKTVCSNLRMQNDDSIQTNNSIVTSFNSSTQDHSLLLPIESNTSASMRLGTPQTPQSQSRRSANSSTRVLASTPNSNEKMRHNSSSTICLGDFLTSNTSSNSRQHKKKPQQQQLFSTDTPNVKPKKRVVPTTISTRTSAGQTGTPFGIANSSFSNENNMLKMPVIEFEDRNKYSMEARKSLKLAVTNISTELEEIKIQSTGENYFYSTIENKLKDVTEIDEISKINIEVLSSVDLTKVTDRSVLERLGNIYSILIDLNYVPNVLGEISLILNLLNTNELQREDGTAAIDHNFQLVDASQSTTNLNLLQNFTNCIYFALHVLKLQQRLLALLDLKSLCVVLNTERIISLAEDLKLYLNNIYEQKQHLDAIKTAQYNTSTLLDKSFKLVHYQAEKDSREHFASLTDFIAFKSQRDLFFKILKIWEENHLKPSWSLSTHMANKVQEIFKLSENPVNMVHFAKLFIDQLLKTSTDTTSPEEVGLDKDLEKYSKLTQRLTAPSNFSAEYQFPRHQAFFRDFIIESRSIPFTTQLKIVLFSELTLLNDSTFEQINLVNIENDINDDEAIEHNTNNEFAVHPDTLASMLTLAKFLGFVTAFPYANVSTTMPGNIEKKQIMLRSVFQTEFNLSNILRAAIRDCKLLITLPWLVQYMAMLDNVTLQTDNFIETTQILFSLYIQLSNNNTALRPASTFILRCCLGWLFETKPIIMDQYYNYRASCAKTVSASMKPNMHFKKIPLLISNHLTTVLPTDEQTLIIASVSRSTDGTYTCVLQQQQEQELAINLNLCEKSKTSKLELNPMLESLLSVACPFLAEFRLSIMPAKFAMAKYVSRTGRYRHITTRIAELQTINNQAIAPATQINNNNQQHNDHSPQNKLVDAFLHAQNSSMCRLINFLAERTYKCVVKDAQCKILIPSKSKADKRVNQITATDYKTVSESVRTIYTTAKKAALNEWHTQVPEWLDARIKNSLDSLLAEETRPIIKETYAYLIRRSATQKLQQWFNSNFVMANFYCENFKDMTQKICKVNEKKSVEKRSPSTNSEIMLFAEIPSVSDLIDELQYLLHCTSLRADLISNNVSIKKFLQELPLAFKNVLPTTFYTLVGTGIVRLLQHIITWQPWLLTKDIIDAACQVWLLQPMLDANTHSNPLPQTNESHNRNVDDDNEHIPISPMFKNGMPNMFDGLITVPFIITLGNRRFCFNKLKDLLVKMVKHNIISIDYININVFQIFKVDLEPEILQEISLILNTISQDTISFSRNNNEWDSDSDDIDKSHLLMEVLADFSRDIDKF